LQPILQLFMTSMWPNTCCPFLPQLTPSFLYLECALWKPSNDLSRRSVLSQALCWILYQKDSKMIKSRMP
jgi:hypothetical protein